MISVQHGATVLKRSAIAAVLFLLCVPQAPAQTSAQTPAQTPAQTRAQQPPEPWAFIDTQIAAHPKSTGVYVLERGEDALLARAWFADHAQRSIDIQYFIWSADNIGELASAALLRAANRGVRVRVIVDDLLVDAPDKALLALAKHPKIDIRIYNPKHSVGTRAAKRALNVATDFRGVNQRMHDKTFTVDGKIAITGGRNMADEYFDFDHAYNFRDRDALLVGAVVPEVQASFARFWDSARVVPVEELYDGWGLMQKNVKLDSQEVQAVYRELNRYAADDANFSPAIRATIESIPKSFPTLAQQLRWTKARFLSDTPGKNASRFSLAGGGQTTAALAGLLESARREVLIESPYLVLSAPALKLFASLRARGVRACASAPTLSPQPTICRPSVAIATSVPSCCAWASKFMNTGRTLPFACR